MCAPYLYAAHPFVASCHACSCLVASTLFQQSHPTHSPPTGMQQPHSDTEHTTAALFASMALLTFGYHRTWMKSSVSVNSFEAARGFGCCRLVGGRCSTGWEASPPAAAAAAAVAAALTALKLPLPCMVCAWDACGRGRCSCAGSAGPAWALGAALLLPLAPGSSISSSSSAVESSSSTAAAVAAAARRAAEAAWQARSRLRCRGLGGAYAAGLVPAGSQADEARCRCMLPAQLMPLLLLPASYHTS